MNLRQINILYIDLLIDPKFVLDLLEIELVTMQKTEVYKKNEFFDIIVTIKLKYNKCQHKTITIEVL